MKIVCCLILILLVTCFSYGQHNFDSVKLLYLLEKAKGNQIDASRQLAQIAWLYYNASKWDSALFYSKATIKTSSERDPILRASVLSNMGNIYRLLGFRDSTIYCFNESLKYYRAAKDTSIMQVNAVANLALAYSDLGLYEKSLQTIFAILNAQEKLPPSRQLASLYNTIGAVHLSIGDHKKAFLFYRKALGIRKVINYNRGVGQSYNNIGEVYMKVHYYDSARIFFISALKIKKEVGENLASVYNNLGEVALVQRKFDDAELFFKQSLESSINNVADQTIACNNLGQTMIMEQRYADAIRYLKRGFDLANRSKNLNLKKVNLEYMEQLLKETGNRSKALSIADELMSVKDSLLNAQKAESLTQMQVQYETGEKEQKISALEQEKRLRAIELQNIHNWNFILILAAVLLATVVFFVFWLYRATTKNKTRIELLMRELHHRVKNSLQMLSSLFVLQSVQLKDPEAISAIKAVEGRVTAMVLIHQKLYSGGYSSSIDLKTYLSDLVYSLVQSYGFVNKVLNLTLKIDETSLDADEAISLGLIVNELVSNAFKHAYDQIDQPELTVELKRRNAKIIVNVSDNGNGASPVKFEAKGSFGLSLVSMLTKELKGIMDMRIDHGTHFSFTIPVRS